MDQLHITIKGVDYPLATNLRVAFKVQGQNDHKPYAEIFEDIPNMTLEKQVAILYASATSADPEFSKLYTETAFREYCLDNMNLKELLDLLKKIIQGIMGASDENKSDNEAAAEKNE